MVSGMSGPAAPFRVELPTRPALSAVPVLSAFPALPGRPVARPLAGAGRSLRARGGRPGSGC